MHLRTEKLQKQKLTQKIHGFMRAALTLSA